ncbi:cytochrome b/b6 domain-containing protein [Pantoea sp.]|uniref:cytochrome b n=1 Tax=Pantoea sp. TaxID=69393 RepID=UPI00289849EC|nr:cytochrome b/b6 domain-containing protein [Pantoea sp.]
MDNSNVRARYDKFSRLLHWVCAVGIIYASIVGYALHFITDKKIFAFFSELNMSLATVVTVLMVMRFVWRFFRPSVPYGSHITGAKKGAIVFMHELFYLIIFVVLISGFIMLEHGYRLFGLVNIPQPVRNEAVNHFFFMIHRGGCIALSVMLLLHVAAVAKHHWVDKNPILSRMR